MGTRRAEAFSDGVFAVAITVLVFNLLQVADNASMAAHAQQLHHGGPGAGGVLLSSWRSYLAYVISFLTIGIMWLNHHQLMAHVRRVNRPLLMLNLLLLLGIVAVPFPTALVADQLTGPGGTAATVTYGLVMLEMSLSFGAIWMYQAAHPAELGIRRPAVMTRAATVRFTIGNVGYLAAPLIALASPVAALVIFGLLAVYYLFNQLPEPEPEPEAEPSRN